MRDPVQDCRSCGKPMVWTKTSKGKNMPCDLSPSPDGTFYLFRKEDHVDAVFHKSREPRAQKARARSQQLHTPHWATCPNADEHRSRG